MSKTVVTKKGNFTTIHNKLITDNSISLKAKGIMLYMLSKPAGWNYNPKDIANNSKDGLDSVYSGLKELIEAKYISRRKNKDGTVDYFVFEDNSENDITDYSNLNPNRENSNLGKPDMENPNLENPDVLIIKNSTNKEFNKKELSNKEKNIKKEKTKNKVQEFINNLNQDEEYKELLFKYVEYRKSIKKPIKTVVPIQKILKDFSDWFSLDEAINIAMEKEWQGLEPEWIVKYKQSKTCNNYGNKIAENKDTSQFLVDDDYIEQMNRRYGLKND